MFPAHHNQARPSIDSAPLCLNAAIDTPSPYYGEAADTNSRKFWSEARIYVLCLFLVAYYHHKSAHSNAIGYRIADPCRRAGVVWFVDLSQELTSPTELNVRPHSLGAVNG
jgi:hypothetical protein